MKVRIALFALLLPTLAYARAPQNTVSRAAAPPALTGFRGEFIANLDEVQAKLIDLAESTPAEKYSWRPAKDVRSISEVYMHIAGSNYFLASYLGTPAPAIPDLEKSVTRKDEVLVELRKSFDHLRTAAAKTTNLDKQVKLFNNNTSHRGVMLTILTHIHEHLGQSIAYARTNGVTPPWSRQ
jgi:uncharacterized damage-inducible protein DinB